MFHAKSKSSPRFFFFALLTASLKKIPFLLIFLHCGFHSHAQQYSFRNYTVADGLGSSSVNHIFQDSKGYIWFATQGGGASRFNGKEFKNFTKADGLINNDVTYITEDASGNIWIGTAAGASRFNGTAFLNYTSKEGLTDGVVYSIHADMQNLIWFATQENGIRIFNGTVFDSITIENGLHTNESYYVTQDKQGNYWFGLVNGIVKYRDGKFTNYADSASVAGKAYFCALVDDSNAVWFGSIGSGVVVIRNEKQIQHAALPEIVQADFIGGIAQDNRGYFWFATDHGLLKYTGNEFNLFSEHQGLSVNLAQTVFCDYEGNIWAGTLGGGVNLLSSEAFVHYTNKHGLASKNITCIHPADDDKFYYIGTGEGVYLFSPAAENQFKKVTVTGITEVEQMNITSLSADANGNLWLCAQKGVFVLKKAGNNFRLLRKYQSIAGEHIVSPTKVIHDAKGNCWIATYGSGIFMVNEKTEKSFSTKTGFASDKILTLYEDAHRTIWAGTQDAGIFRFDGTAFQSIAVEHYLADRAVWTIAEDAEGNIYWGSGESGIYRYDGNVIKTYSAKEGLQTNYITTLSWDKNECCMWAGSETGIQKIFFSGEGAMQHAHAYSELDGFYATGINPGSLLFIQDGTLLIGTQDGLWLFDRRQDFPKNIPPKVQLTGIRLFYQHTDWKQFNDSLDNSSQLPVDLELPYNKNHLTFDIQALTTQAVHYTFKLEGQEEQWSAPVRNNAITYSNISPGEYTFYARAINASGIASAVVSFSFTVNSPWWNTWWFRIAAVLFAIGALVSFIKAREQVLRERNLKLEETVKQRTLEIAQQKEVVEKMLGEKEGLLHEKEILLKEIHHRVKNNLQTISSMLMLQSAGLKDEQAKKAIAESQSRVRSIELVHQKLYQTEELEKVELSAFTKDLTEQVKSLHQHRTKQVAIQLNIPETYILIDTAIPLGLMLNELLTNSFKYAFTQTPVAEILIELVQSQNGGLKNGKQKKVQLRYRDNGPGLQSMETLENATTLGLRLIKLLSQQIGATLEYSNSKGSEFIFTFELNNEHRKCNEAFEYWHRGR
ncbi:MAG TPA: two-component regulator propeller domain-containing protein [Chitinophagales bacterium]|nr:two-component regulator propeller domain-containing protein [Chitinophagales bacterium]